MPVEPTDHDAPLEAGHEPGPKAGTRQPGALRSDTWMTLQTRQAQQLVHGRAVGEGKAGIIGLTRFSALVRQIWIGARADDPYADWWLLKIHDALERSRHDLDHARRQIEARLESVPAIDIQVAHSVEPVRVPLRFSHAYAFRGAYLLAALDEVVRALLTARHVGLMSRNETERELAEAARVVRRAFTSPSGYRFLGITRAELAQPTARVRQALELMGTVPDAVVHGERTVPYGPKAQGGFASMNASATSPPTPTAGADEDLGTGASAS